LTDREIPQSRAILFSLICTTPGLPLAKIGNDSRTMRKDCEELVRVVFDLGVRREPQVFAADAVISLGFMDIQ